MFQVALCIFLRLSSSSWSLLAFNLYSCPPNQYLFFFSRLKCREFFVALKLKILPRDLIIVCCQFQNSLLKICCQWIFFYSQEYWFNNLLIRIKYLGFDKSNFHHKLRIERKYVSMSFFLHGKRIKRHDSNASENYTCLMRFVKSTFFDMMRSFVFEDICLLGLNNFSWTSIIN